ncbi:MAG: peroxiredoxin family protein [Terriglobales bacterium]
MFEFKRYNYRHFTKDLLMNDVLLKRFGGPKPGERAPNFKARTLDGEEIELGDYRGEKNVVLTFGSATCVATANCIGGMNELYEQYAGDDVEFLFCYVREAHPGERLPAHASMEHKVRAAQVFRDEEEVRMPIIVDDVHGSIHKKYGKLRNATFIIDKSGRVAFRAVWTRPGVIEDALEELLERQRERDVEHAIVNGGEDVALPRGAMLHAYRALQRGGKTAIREFKREMGVPGQVAIATGRMVQPIAENPAKSALLAGATAGVVIGAVLLGRFLRERRFRTRTPYDIEGLGIPRRSSHGDHGDYEAVGI